MSMLAMEEDEYEELAASENKCSLPTMDFVEKGSEYKEIGSSEERMPVEEMEEASETSVCMQGKLTKNDANANKEEIEDKEDKDGTKYNERKEEIKEDCSHEVNEDVLNEVKSKLSLKSNVTRKIPDVPILVQELQSQQVRENCPLFLVCTALPNQHLTATWFQVPTYY